MRTPLYDEHVRLGARIVDFSGWEMPVVYGGIIDEHRFTREHCSLFDTCHMGKFEIRGRAAQADLERILTQPLAALAPGRGAYGYILNEKGGVLDDQICFRRSADCFWLIVNAGTTPSNEEWVRSRLSPESVLVDLSLRYAKFDVQGPKARESMDRAFGAAMPDMKYFHLREVDLLGMSCMVSRTGYTGEFGYELFTPIDSCADFWRRLLAGGGARPAGLGARDTLRVEMGYPLYGHELGPGRTPAGIGGARFMNMDKDFTGRDAVRSELERGGFNVLAGLRLEGRASARSGDRVVMDGVPVGEVTSGLFAPSLGVAVAMAYVAPSAAAPGARLGIDVRGRLLPAKVVGLPFHKSGTCRRKENET